MMRSVYQRLVVEAIAFEPKETPMAHVMNTLSHKTLTFSKRKATGFVVVHCADTPAKMDVGVNDIRQWHIARGWKDVGYHYVIRRSGLVETGRRHDVLGAHVAGYNAVSVGVCMVGRERNYSDAQWQSLGQVLVVLTAYYKGAKVVGHCDLDPVGKRNCPGFDVRAWWASFQSGAIDRSAAFVNVA